MEISRKIKYFRYKWNKSVQNLACLANQKDCVFISWKYGRGKGGNTIAEKLVKERVRKSSELGVWERMMWLSRRHKSSSEIKSIKSGFSKNVPSNSQAMPPPLLCRNIHIGLRTLPTGNKGDRLFHSSELRCLLIIPLMSVKIWIWRGGIHLNTSCNQIALIRPIEDVRYGIIKGHHC